MGSESSFFMAFTYSPCLPHRGEGARPTHASSTKAPLYSTWRTVPRGILLGQLLGHQVRFFTLVLLIFFVIYFLQKPFIVYEKQNSCPPSSNPPVTAWSESAVTWAQRRFSLLSSLASCIFLRILAHYSTGDYLQAKWKRQQQEW